MDEVKPPRGAPHKPEHLRVKVRAVRLNEADYATYKAVGRDKWLRLKLKEEREVKK